MSTTITEMRTAPMETVHVKLQAYPPTVPKPKARLKLDPQRALEPARKKLSTLESQRIMAVLVDSIKKGEVVTSLIAILENLAQYRIMLGSDLVQMLENHKVMIDSFQELKVQTEKHIEREQVVSQSSYERQNEVGEDYEKSGTFGINEIESSQVIDNGDDSIPGSAMSNDSQLQILLHQMSLMAGEMQHSCKNILRGFSINPTALDSILKDQHSKTNGAEDMIYNMKELKDIIMNMLLTTPVEESERNHYLKEISQRERHNAGIIEKLDSELQLALEDKENEIKKKNDIIRRLQSDLHQIEKFSEEHIRRTKSEAEKQEAADSKNSEGKRQKLQQEIIALKAQVQNLTQEHRDSEQTLRRNKFRYETEVENWIQKYDQDMGERQDEFEEIDAVYTEEKKQLNELEERFKTLEEEYNQIQEERRVARERREAAERELAMSVMAATTIQAFWRSFKVRKALKSKKKKGGRKGKKGKK